LTTITTFSNSLQLNLASAHEKGATEMQIFYHPKAETRMNLI